MCENSQSKKGRRPFILIIIILLIAIEVAIFPTLFPKSQNKDGASSPKTCPVTNPARTLGQPQGKLQVSWGKDYQIMNYTFRGVLHELPAIMTKENFPPPGQKPVYSIKKNWPNFTLYARWTASTEGWPKDYRKTALDFILIRASDPELMKHTYPKTIKESYYTYPPEFIAEATSQGKLNLLDKVRGALLSYEVKADAGFGASDYIIKTSLRIGVSDDEKTVFSFDNPVFISDYLEIREVIFAARDAGDNIYFDIRVKCVCSPRRIFRDVAMQRVENDTKYFIEQMYKYLSDAPTKKEITTYYDILKHIDRELKVQPRK